MTLKEMSRDGQPAMNGPVVENIESERCLTDFSKVLFFFLILESGLFRGFAAGAFV